jgi:hypothetical protein
METGQTGAIAERAYQIWEREGRPHGRDMDHWLQAERELKPGDGQSQRSRAALRKPAKAASTAKPKATKSRAPRKTAGNTKSPTT